jgi:hypothetical protein
MSFYVRTENWDTVVSKNFGITLSISPRQCNPISKPTPKLDIKLQRKTKMRNFNYILQYPMPAHIEECCSDINDPF